MKKAGFTALVLSMCMLLTSCGIRRPDAKTQAVEEETGVIMVYMVGSDLESESGMASLDIKEMLKSDFCEENLKVLICTGGANYWWTHEIPADECVVFEVTGGELNPVYTMKNENMGRAKTLREFINYSYINYSADSYGLVLWDHGGGAVLGFGADEKHDYDALSMKELDDALEGTKLIADGKKFEWIGFDACLMGMLEVANTMSGYAHYMIASEEFEAGQGWNYSCLKSLSDGKHFDGVSVAEEIIAAYRNYYEEEYIYTPDYTLSCLDLSRTDEVIGKFNDLVAVIEEELYNGGYSTIARQRDETKSFGKTSSDSFYDTVDLYDLSEKMLDLYPEEAQELQEALEKMVVCEESNIIDAHGVAVYFPYDNKDYAGEWIEEYSRIGFSEPYVGFLKAFEETLSGEQLASWDIADTAPVESEENAGEYYVQLTEEQVANYGHASYSVWEEDSEGTYICWTDSTEVVLDGNGRLGADFDGRQFFLTDASGELHCCCATELERNDEYAKYSIPIIVERMKEKDGEKSFSIDSAFIHVRVDAEHPDGVIIGIYEDMNTDSNIFPDKGTFEIREGDSIMPFLFARDIVFLEDGSVAPFEEWSVSSGTGKYFLLEGELSVTMQPAEEGTEYCCLFRVTDTQGNFYYTNPIYLQY